MAVSLTRDELLTRLEKRSKLLEVAVIEDTKDLSGSPGGAKVYVRCQDGDIEIHEFIARLMSRFLLRAIDLAYLDLD